jgi:uncharacterized protein YqeY
VYVSNADLKTRLRREIAQALKSRERVRLSALRLLSASIVNREKELRRELSDEEVRDVAVREVKRRTEAIEAYDAAGRAELAAREREERDVLAAYAPEQLSEAEVDALVEEAVASTGASSPRDLGKVMGAVMGRAKGRVDGSQVQAKVRERLGA